MVRQMRGRGAYGVVKARYIHNRSPKTGRPVTADLQRVMYYNVYGNSHNNPDLKPRGRIYDEQGREVSYGAYKSWGLGQSHHHPYTYRVIISPKGHLLNDADFVTAVAATLDLAPQFRLVVHRDTAHAHGHLLFQTDRTIRRAELENWKEALRHKLLALEQARAEEKGVSLPAVDGEESATTPQRGRRRSRRRSRGKERGLSL